MPGHHKSTLAKAQLALRQPKTHDFQISLEEVQTIPGEFMPIVNHLVLQQQNTQYSSNPVLTVQTENRIQEKRVMIKMSLAAMDAQVIVKRKTGGFVQHLDKLVTLFVAMVF